MGRAFHVIGGQPINTQLVEACTDELDEILENLAKALVVSRHEIIDLVHILIDHPPRAASAATRSALASISKVAPEG